MALVFLGVGSRRAYEVQPSPDVVHAAAKPSPPPWEMPSFAPRAEIPPPPPPAAPNPAVASISDLSLVENTTFTGVTRREGRLTFTYDPTQKRGKRSCPT